MTRPTLGAGAIRLDGERLAARRLPLLRERAARVTAGRGRAPTLGIVAFSTGEGPAPHVAKKVRACRAAGVDVAELVVRPTLTAREAREAMHRLAHDESRPLDGVFLQFPYPDESFGPLLEAGIPEAMDVDVMSPGRVRQFRDDEEALPPVTVSAALSLIDAGDLALAGRRGVVIAERSPFAEMFRLAFARRGARMSDLCPPDSPELTDVLAAHDLVIVAAGRVGLVDAASIASGAIAIDVGYFNPGGRGDIDLSHGVEHLAAIAAVPGSIGPMTVSCLIERTILFAEASG